MPNRKPVTHYDNLKVAHNAPNTVIRAAYRVLVQQFHPDKFPNRTLAEHRVKIINKAYEVLSDPGKRREHDVWIAAQQALSGGSESERTEGQTKIRTNSATATTKPAGGVNSLRSNLGDWGRRVERLVLGVTLLLLILLLGVENNGVSSLLPGTGDKTPICVKF